MLRDVTYASRLYRSAWCPVEHTPSCHHSLGSGSDGGGDEEAGGSDGDAGGDCGGSDGGAISADLSTGRHVSVMMYWP